MVTTRLAPAAASMSATRRAPMEIRGASFLSDLAYAKCGMTAVTVVAEAPRAASSISSSSNRWSCTGGASVCTTYTSRRRQFARSWTCRQSLLNRVVRDGDSSTPRISHISSRERRMGGA